MPYPEEPGSVAVDTSQAAAESIKGTAASLRAQVLSEIKSNGIFGLTCDELENMTGMRHQTASARCRELELMKLVIKTHVKRHTRSGRQARVYIAPEHMPNAA